MFTPLDKFNVESLYNSKASIEVANKDRIEKGLEPLDSSNYGENELDYLWSVTFKYCPDVDVDENGKTHIIDNNAPLGFTDRYNERKLTLQNKVYNYQKNKDIQDCLMTLGLDSEKFWYLLLFITDYCEGECIDNIKTTDGAGKQIQEFIDLIFKGKDYYRQAEHNIFTLRKIEYDEPVELVLKIGKKKITITDSNTIGLIGIMCNGVYSDIKEAGIFMGNVHFGESMAYSDTAMAYLFCQMFKYFFDTTDHIRERRAAGASISNKEKELLSYLLYFTSISKNKNLLNPFANDYNTIKGLMNPKKKPEFKGINNYYI